MLKAIEICFILAFSVRNIKAASDSVPEAITVYRNPEFFRKVHYITDQSIYEFGDSDNYEDPDDQEYKYPGEPKKPNPPAPPNFDVNYDGSPEFSHEPRDIFRDSDRPPKRGRGPYGHPRVEEDEELNEEEEGAEIQIEEDEGNPDDANIEEEQNEINEEENEEIEDEEAEQNEEPEPNEETQNSENVEEEEEAEPQTESEPESGSYEESGSYQESDSVRIPNAYEKSVSYSTPNTYESTSTKYAYPGEYKEPEVIVDRKKGTREYYKHHKKPESEDEIDDESEQLRDGRNYADTKLVFKKSKFFIPKKFVFKVKKRPKKFKIKVKKPKKFFKFKSRYVRQVPDNSAYQLSSDLDLEYQRV